MNSWLKVLILGAAMVAGFTRLQANVEENTEDIKLVEESVFDKEYLKERLTGIDNRLDNMAEKIDRVPELVWKAYREKAK